MAASDALAWDATRADLEEAFLLWASPKAQYSGAPQAEAYELLLKDPPATAAVLPQFLASPSGSIRDKILTLSEQLGASAVGPAFRPHAAADSPNLSAVMFCLSRSGDTESLPILVRHLGHPRPGMRSTAALSVGYLRQPQVLGDLLWVLSHDTDRGVRKSAAFAVGQCADSASVSREVLDGLVAALNDDFFGVRYNAAKSLAILADPAGARISSAYETLTDTARFFAVYALGRMRDAASSSFLESVAADTAAPMVVRGAAVKGLLDRKHPIDASAYPDLRAAPAGRGQFGLVR